MKQLHEDLWQTRIDSPFTGLNTNAYLLKASGGNVLLYGTSHEDAIDAIAEHEGVAYQLLSHRDEAGPALKTIKDRYGSQLGCHTKEEPVIAEYCPVDVTFSERTKHETGIEIIPTPGHTEGSLSFLYASPHGKTYLFTGDTLYRSGDGWGTLPFPGAGGSVKTLIESLKIYRELEPDIVISSAYVGDSPIAEMTPGQWKQDVDEAIRDLSA